MKTLKRIPKNSKSEYAIVYLAKHVHAKFQLSNLYPDGLRQIFDLFSRKNQDFLKENLEFSKSEKKSEQRFPKGIFYQIFSHLAFLKVFKTDFKIF
jgi:hypothetical protein